MSKHNDFFNEDDEQAFEEMLRAEEAQEGNDGGDEESAIEDLLFGDDDTDSPREEPQEGDTEDVEPEPDSGEGEGGKDATEDDRTDLEAISERLPATSRGQDNVDKEFTEETLFQVASFTIFLDALTQRDSDIFIQMFIPRNARRAKMPNIVTAFVRSIQEGEVAKTLSGVDALRELSDMLFTESDDPFASFVEALGKVSAMDEDVKTEMFSVMRTASTHSGGKKVNTNKTSSETQILTDIRTVMEDESARDFIKSAAELGKFAEGIIKF